MRGLAHPMWVCGGWVPSFSGLLKFRTALGRLVVGKDKPSLFLIKLV